MVIHDNISSGGHCSVAESKLHINVLELLIDYHTSQIYSKNTSAYLKADNTTVVAWINKQINSSNWNRISNSKMNLKLRSTEKLQIYAAYIEPKKIYKLFILSLMSKITNRGLSKI